MTRERFDDGWVDIQTDDQKRAARDGMVRHALVDLGPHVIAGALGQERGIRKRTPEDDRIAGVIRAARVLLESIATPEPAAARARRRRR